MQVVCFECVGEPIKAFQSAQFKRLNLGILALAMNRVLIIAACSRIRRGASIGCESFNVTPQFTSMHKHKIRDP